MGKFKQLISISYACVGVQIYRKFYTEEKERSNGVLGLCVATSAAQPYIALASMLSVSSFTAEASRSQVSHKELISCYLDSNIHLLYN